jgi:non-specific serine/threonine protein kinase/serine/threonine-protein kinase
MQSGEGASARDYWDRVEAVFAAALAAEDTARTEVLDAECSLSPELRTEVEALLAAHARAGNFIAPRTPDFSATTGEADTPAARIGPFELRERIGLGGMGDVYRAERVEGEFTQQVAVKLIHARLQGAETIRRFRAERQILASLQHPNIVTLIDGGVTAGGQPFIVMEYVDGLPLTDFCRRHPTPLEARLHLFQQLCAAVGFAHRHLVVHRDLKPANVFVTGEGVVKVLDFGVAKLLQPRGEGSGVTMSLLAPMTPNYASPEQVRGQPVTTACDMYALGVMLYELLSGTRPYETTGKTVDEVLAIVGDHDPVRPSTVRGTGMPYEPRRLRGDLDAIVWKAMAKEPTGRYASAEELSDDLARFLAGSPVVAREPSLVYLTRKAVLRHRAAFGIAAVALVLLVTALIGAVWQARVAARERERAEQGLADVRALANSLVFEVHDAIQFLPGATAARQLIVKRALEYVDRLAAGNPRDLALRRELAGAYYRLAEVQGNPVRANLGDLDGALASYQKALALREQIASETADDSGDVQQAADAAFGMATVLRTQGDMAGARAALTRVVERLEPLAERPVGATDALKRLVAAYQRLAEIANSSNDADEAARLVARALPHAEAAVRQDPADTTARLNLSQLYREEADSLTQRAKFPEALARTRESRVMLEQLMAEHPLDTRYHIGLLFVLASEGYLLEQNGQLPDARSVYEHQVDVARTRARRDPNDSTAQIGVAIALRQLGALMIRMGRLDEARAHTEEGRKLMAAVVARDPTNSWAVDDYATLAALLGEALAQSAAATDRTRACTIFDEARRHWDLLKDRNAFPRQSAQLYEATLSRLRGCDANSQR